MENPISFINIGVWCILKLVIEDKWEAVVLRGTYEFDFNFPKNQSSIRIKNPEG